MTKFHQHQSTLKGRSAGQRHADRQTDKPVGFYGPIVPPVPNAQVRNALELQSLHAAALPFNQNIPPSIVLLQQCYCRHRHRTKLQNLSPPSVLFEWSLFFYNTQETQTQKMMDQNFETQILWFLSIFWNFQKGIARWLQSVLYFTIGQPFPPSKLPLLTGIWTPI